MPDTLQAGCDQSVTYVRTDPVATTDIENVDTGETVTRPARIHPTIDTVTALLGTTPVELSHNPTWDDTDHRIEDGREQGQEYVLQLDGSEAGSTDGAGFSLEYAGTDPDGSAFTDIVTYTVVAPNVDGVPLLATVADLAAYGYVGGDTMLRRASVRIMEYVQGRVSAASITTATTLPYALVELCCAVAYRMEKTDAQVVKGVQSESLEGGGVTWGAEAYAGTSGLTSEEKRRLDKLFPYTPRTVEIL